MFVFNKDTINYFKINGIYNSCSRSGNEYKGFSLDIAFINFLL